MEAIPSWGPNGVLPPINEASPVAVERSPYVVSLPLFVQRFGTTPERRKVLAGLLRYRAALHRLGIVDGFQWLDGSFLEHVELIEDRAPNDIDVVTFYRLPSGRSQRALAKAAGALLDAKMTTREFLVDGYVVCLDTDPQRLTRHAVYWYSVWSRRRDRRWKGFVQVSLGASQDARATAVLEALDAQEAPSS